MHPAVSLGCSAKSIFESGVRVFVCAGVGGAEFFFLLLVVETLHCLGFTLEGFIFFLCVWEHPQSPCSGKMRDTWMLLVFK